MGLLPNTISTAIAHKRLRLGKKPRNILHIFLRFFTVASLASTRFCDESAFGNRPIKKHRRLFRRPECQVCLLLVTICTTMRAILSCVEFLSVVRRVVPGDLCRLPHFL